MDRAEYEVMAAVEDRHWWYGGMRAIVGSLLAPAYGARHDLRILDAGCGTGGNARFLRRYGTVVGIDLAPDALEFGTTRVPGGLVQASVTELPFANASFDLVTSFEVLYHLNVSNDTAALREAARVLRPNGRVLLRLPALELLRRTHDRAVHTRHRYTLPEVCGLLERAGFAVERATYANSLMFPLALAQSVLERALPAAPEHESDITLPAPLVNEAFRWPMAAEAAWVAHGHGFPIGVSAVCLAKKRDF